MAPPKEPGNFDQLFRGAHGGDPILARLWWRIVLSVVLALGDSHGLSSQPRLLRGIGGRSPDETEG